MLPKKKMGISGASQEGSVDSLRISVRFLFPFRTPAKTEFVPNPLLTDLPNSRTLKGFK